MPLLFLIAHEIQINSMAPETNCDCIVKFTGNNVVHQKAGFKIWCCFNATTTQNYKNKSFP